jgi:hypothetical protein
VEESCDNDLCLLPRPATNAYASDKSAMLEPVKLSIPDAAPSAGSGAQPFLEKCAKVSDCKGAVIRRLREKRTIQNRRSFRDSLGVDPISVGWYSEDQRAEAQYGSD